MRNVFILFFGVLALANLGFASLGVAQVQPAADGGIFASTRLVDLSFDGMNSGIVRQAARQGFELSGGDPVDLSRWYAPQMPNLRAVFSTQVSRDLALVWGGSLGERGTKYSLGPSGVIGMTYRRQISRRATLGVEVYGQFGGALREGSCMGDYGALGGVQEVNCRLAASTLSPRQTLDYLWNAPPSVDASVRLTYQFRF